MGKRTEGIDKAGTHLPVLVQLINNTDGSVLEMGAGMFSTPLLYWVCKSQDRLFVSYENDEKWAKKVGSMTTYLENWDLIDIESIQWGIVFIDHRPAMRRHVDAIRAKDSALYVVLHDSEPEIDKFYVYHRVYPHFKYVYQFDRLKPNTAICSNYFDPTRLFMY